MIDWLPSFERKFNDGDIVSKLKERKFYGKVSIHFQAGEPLTVHVDMSFKPPKEEKEVISGSS